MKSERNRNDSVQSGQQKPAPQKLDLSIRPQACASATVASPDGNRDRVVVITLS